MTVEGAPVWNLATLMPDGAVGASAAGGRAVLLAREFADEHRGQVGRYDADADAESDAGPPDHGALHDETEDMTARVQTLVTFVEKTVTGAGVRQDSRRVHQDLIDRHLDEARDVAAAILA